ncbi:HEAT repeat domain-containing protein [Nostoc sp. PCC 9305]|uniref:HEAT repeat domain-containing protein n=1 Tax=Nostoc sp. PCC 9305 TaxID=296636 RepID=UPI0039C6BF32
MAITIDINTDKSINLEEYIEYISSTVDLKDLDSIIESAEHLKALANNRHFLIKRFNRELLEWNNFQTTNSYSSQTLMLGNGKGFFVRANMWMPPSKVPEDREWQNKVFSYLFPHDHNFSFLTVGYLGSGYGTTIYEYDSEKIIGVPGEKVNLRFLEHTFLPEGKIMLYRASRDVHSQEHPQEFSISLNLMIVSPEININNQYSFDLNAGTITDYVKNPGTGRVMLCHLARYIGDSTTVNTLESLAMRHSSPRLRATAYDSLAVLEKNSALEIWQQALQDKHFYVQHVAQTALKDLDR